jgi:hypothetical protein
MADPHVSLDPASLGPVERKLQGALEEQLSSALAAATEQVRSGYAGQSVDEVCRELLDGARGGLHPDIAAGFHPDPAELRRLAEAIVSDAG